MQRTRHAGTVSSHESMPLTVAQLGEAMAAVMESAATAMVERERMMREHAFTGCDDGEGEGTVGEGHLMYALLSNALFRYTLDREEWSGVVC